MRMIVIEQSCLLSILTLTLLIRQNIDAVASRCYLCSQHTLPECAGSNQPNSTIYSTVLRYYTEPCNGQCVFFRNDNQSVVRGCSWTYGHMQPKLTGWHEISPGVSAYFCDSPLCNNGTFEDQLTTTMRTEMMRNQVPLPLEQLLAIATNQSTDVYSSRRLRQCYACTARYKGCGEFLDPAYVSNYIRPCSSSCIVFRNPNDLNLITRDCSSSWPEVRGKSGLHRILGSEAFFCEESLCNGIGFDFIMGIFHNQLPAMIRFPLTTTVRSFTTTIINPDDDDPFIDDEVDSTPVSLSETFNNGSLSMENFDLADDLEMSTIKDSLVAVQEQLPMNWWNLNDTTSTTVDAEDEWIIFNTTSVPFVTRLGHLSADAEDSDEIHSPDPSSQSNQTTTMNEFLPSPQTTTTTKPYVESLFEYCKDQQCHNGGRLNSDCLCICLPAFAGESCQTVLCDQEPAHICNFVFEYECQSDYVQYLCPKFCATKLCPSTSADGIQ